MAFADTTITNYQGYIRLDRAIQISSYDRRLNTSSLHFKSPGLQAPGSNNLKSATSILCNESSVFDDQILDGGVTTAARCGGRWKELYHWYHSFPELQRATAVQGGLTLARLRGLFHTRAFLDPLSSQEQPGPTLAELICTSLPMLNPTEPTCGGKDQCAAAKDGSGILLLLQRA
jgi:hypothetical protein